MFILPPHEVEENTMTKIKFIIAMLIVCAMLSVSSFAEAADISVDDNSGIMTISGTAEGAAYGAAVSITVIKPNPEGDDTDYSAKSITEIIDADMLAAYMPALTASDGAYKAEISMSDNQPGDYTIIITTSADAKNPSVQSFYYASLENKTDLIKAAAEYLSGKDATTAGLAEILDIKAADSKNARLLAIKADSVIFKVSADGFDKTVYEVLKNTKELADMQPSDFVAKLEYAAKLTAFSEGVLNPIDYAEEFNLDADFIATYKDALSDTQKSAFAKLIIGSSIYTDEQLQKLFKDIVCLAVIQNPGSWGDYTKLISKHGAYMGINMTSYNALSNPDKVTDSLSAGYNTIDEFKKAVNAAITSLSGGSKGGGTTGGTGGIGSGGYKGGTSTGTSVGGGTISGDTKTEAPQTTDGSFSDLDSVPWAVESIKALVKKEIVNGIGRNMFDPDGNVTREQFAKMAVLAAGLEIDGTETAFEDVEAEAWYSKYIAAAVKGGIINGVSDTMFGTGEAVTRQDAAAILYRLAGKPAVSRGETFADDSDIADYAKDAVYALKSAGIINGRDDNTFDPSNTCTRAEAAKMIYEFMLNKE